MKQKTNINQMKFEKLRRLLLLILLLITTNLNVYDFQVDGLCYTLLQIIGVR